MSIMTSALQASGSTVNINELALIGVGAIIVVMLASVLVQAGLSFLAQRNLNDQLSLGIQGVVGVNNVRTVDNQQEPNDAQQDGGE